MTCAKVRVVAFLVGRSGKWYDGENWCANPQQVCPRLPGEGYEKCQSVCQQNAHAEVEAIQAAGDDACGGLMYVKYHYCCEACTRACNAAGVQLILTNNGDTRV